jgi:hypothetical protein
VREMPAQKLSHQMMLWPTLPATPLLQLNYHCYNHNRIWLVHTATKSASPQHHDDHDKAATPPRSQQKCVLI